MSVAVKLDENLGRTHVEILRTAGYEVDRVHDQGLSGIPITRSISPHVTPHFSVGDQRISDCARHATGPGNLGTWVMVDMNHYLRYVAEQISQISAKMTAKSSMDEIEELIETA